MDNLGDAQYRLLEAVAYDVASSREFPPTMEEQLVQALLRDERSWEGELWEPFFELAEQLADRVSDDN